MEFLVPPVVITAVVVGLYVCYLRSQLRNEQADNASWNKAWNERCLSVNNMLTECRIERNQFLLERNRALNELKELKAKIRELGE